MDIPRLGLAALAALTLPACISLDLPFGAPQPLVETVIHGSSGPKIALVSIEGTIRDRRNEGGLFGFSDESMVARFREELDRARNDSEVRALIVRIDSPGGAATASDLLYQEALRFKRERGVPVIAQLMGTAASGGYYLAMAADEVIAHPTTVTGSIGVLFANVSLAGLMDKIGVVDQTLTAGEFKDAGSPLRRMTDEERVYLQSVVDELFARFVEVVRAGRPNLAPAEVDALANGRVYTASQAKANGLIDQVGTLYDAIDRAEQRAGLTSSRVVTYHRPREYRENLYTRTPVAPAPWYGSAVRLFEEPGFLYLWLPGLPALSAP